MLEEERELERLDEESPGMIGEHRQVLRSHCSAMKQFLPV
jgi:hypothetical protein